jgi:hypothetical protein
MDAIVQARAAVSDVDGDAITLIRDLPVTTDEEQEFAAKGLRIVKEWHAELEEKRTAITKPMNQALRGVNDLFRPMKTALEEAERVVKRKIAGYLEQKRADNDRAVTEAAAAATAEQAEYALSLVKIVEMPSGTSIRYQWVAVIEDESLLPREYLTPSMAKIVDAVRASDGAIKIPGVSVHQEPIVSSRRSP